MNQKNKITIILTSVGMLAILIISLVFVFCRVVQNRKEEDARNLAIMQYRNAKISRYIEENENYNDYFWHGDWTGLIFARDNDRTASRLAGDHGTGVYSVWIFHLTYFGVDSKKYRRIYFYKWAKIVDFFGDCRCYRFDRIGIFV